MGTAPLIVAFDDMPTLAGRELGSSAWIALDQNRINLFADATDDHQWIHIDEERARAEMGSTIAHGFLTLSLLPRLMDDVIRFEGSGKMLNVGVNRVRFVSPAPSGSRVRLTQSVVSVEARAGGWQLTTDCVIEAEGQDKPPCVAQSVMLVLPPGQAKAA